MAPWNTGNNQLIYVTEEITDEMIAQRDKDIAEAVTSPIVGFNFNTDNVKNELSALQSVMDKYVDTIHTGTENPDTILPRFIEELEANGFDKVLEEMQAQFDAWRS
mgnify:FL=1